MTMKEELINKIKDYFDLNIYETKVWLALLGKGAASAGEIAKMSGVPRSRTYDVLESLEKKGFAITKLGKPVKYLGVKPNVIIEKLKKNTVKEAQEKVNNLAQIKDTEEYNQLRELYEKGINPIKREEVSAALKGNSNISNYLRDVLHEAEKEVIICTTAEDMNMKLRVFRETFDKLDKHGIKTILALSGDERLIKQIEEKLGKRIRRIDIDAKFFIVDRKEILFYLSKNKGKDDTAVWLNSEFFSNAFSGLFDKAIKEAEKENKKNTPNKTSQKTDKKE